MAGADDIREQRPGRVRETQDGFKHARSWKVFARSEFDARRKLRLYRKVFIGAAWYTTYNEVPDASVVCRELDIDPTVPAPLGGVGDYTITASYERPGRDEAVAGGPPIYRLESSLQSAPIDIDADGDPIENLVQEPIEASDFEDREVLRVEWWREFASLSAAFQFIRPFRNSLNLTTWQGVPKGGARCKGVQNMEEVQLESSLLVKLSTSIEVREGIDAATFGSQIVDKTGAAVAGTLEGWAQIKRHVGTRELGAVVDGKQTYKPILTEDGADRITEPVPLDASGARLGDGADPIAIMFNVVPKYKDFAELGI